MYKVGNVLNIRNNWYRVCQGENKPSCGKCWFYSGMRWCCLDGHSSNHLQNIDKCKTLIDINAGQYFSLLLCSDVEEGI